MESTPRFRDSSASLEERVEDLLRRMTLAEKAGQMFHTMITIGPQGTLAPAMPMFSMLATEELIAEKYLTHFNLLGSIEDAKVAAEWNNRIQTKALETRLGIPVTVSTDPRNHFTENIGTGFGPGAFSQWPEPLGLAALRSSELVEQFATTARQEYLAVGLRVCLNPQIDISTDPRWARTSATFGEDAELASQLGVAYIKGFQAGSQIGPHSVACMAKHFPGGGAQKDGEDPHFPYGKSQVYPGKQFDYHMGPFKAAIAAGVSQMMPYYGMPVGTEYEEVGFSFSKQIVTGLLREKLGFQGIVCTDWQLVKDSNIFGEPMLARAWGVEHLDEKERIKKLLDAGCDQFGGEYCPELLIQLVNEHVIPESRVDESVRRLLREKFALGLFDNPFVDADAAAQIVGNPAFLHQGNLTQRSSYTLLTNNNACLPLKMKDAKVYLEGYDAESLKAFGMTPVKDPQDADIALLRWSAPYEKRPGVFESFFHAGSLEFSEAEKARQATILETVPITIVDLYLDRPAIIPEIVHTATAVLANYGSSSQASIEVIFGTHKPKGKLPFDMPSSMDAVRKSREDVPFDTKDPLFKFGHGLSYV